MSEWVEFKDCGKFRLVEGRNKYTIETLLENKSTQPFVFHDKPFTLAQKKGTRFYDAFHGLAESVWSYQDVKNFDEIYKEFCQDILENKVSADELAQIEENKKQAEAENTQNYHKQYYEKRYSEFRDYMMEYDMSALELIVATSRCLCADSVREVVRAFIGYFQTVNGFKGTNVIAIGSPASGKSFILETALSMIPQEYVHYGIMTESAFFETYEGRDLTGHIFFLGDLGGSKDDEKTIIFRDLLKQLTTDGEVTRTISKGDIKDREPVRQKVTGYPALSYSTAKEEIVNEQEKSRSVILTPQPIDSRALLVFNAVMRNHGRFWRDIDEVERVRDSIKGMVYCYNHEKDGDWFNPYMYNIEETLKDNDDFNRKVQEYDATLEVVTRLDNPYAISHTYYMDDENKTTETSLVLSTKRNNLNAMNLFDAVNFLPDEARLGDKLLEYYEVFDLKKLSSAEEVFDEKLPYEEKVKFVLTEDGHEWVSEDETGVAWKKEAVYNRYNGLFSDASPHFQNNLFTISSLKKRFRGKWFNSQKQYLSNRLNKLADGGVLIKIAKVDRENLYALSDDNGSKISEKLPSFDDKSKIEECKATFLEIYPSLEKEWDKFIESDKDKPNEKSLTESVRALFPHLPYIKESNEDV